MSRAIYEYKKRQENGEDFFYCDDPKCNKNFTSVWYFEKHLKVDHAKSYKAFECHICKKRYGHRQSVYNHMWSHNGEKCETCGKSLSSFQAFEGHMRIHSGEKPFECQVPNCNRTFRCRSSLDSHVHHGVGPNGGEKDGRKHACNFLGCTKRFTSKQSLKDHKNLHTGEHPYECCGCGETFTHRKNWKLHEATCNDIDSNNEEESNSFDIDNNIEEGPEMQELWQGQDLF